MEVALARGLLRVEESLRRGRAMAIAIIASVWFLGSKGGIYIRVGGGGREGGCGGWWWFVCVFLQYVWALRIEKQGG